MTDLQFKAFLDRYLNDIKELKEYYEEKDDERFQKKSDRMIDELENALRRCSA